MAVQIPERMTAAEFEQWVGLPQNAERHFEYIAGEAVEVVSNNYSSQVAARILTFLGMYLLENDIGYVTGADGGYVVRGERYISDVGFVSRARQPESCHDAYNPNPPDLAVEVVSPGDRADKLMVKVGNYLSVNTVVWVVYPPEREVQVYAPGESVKLLRMNQTLSGGDVLPGFALAVKDIFPET